jgi:RHS repeat-associated protein
MLDGQSNVAALTNQSGSVVDSYSYDQWGKQLSVSESVPQQLRYAGYWYDNELGWYCLTVRAYDPVLGRFLQPDPSELEGLFSYIYAGDNPSDQGDPSGLIATPPKFGCLLSSGKTWECNVAVGSAQWNFEISREAFAVSGVNGAAQPTTPAMCGASVELCAANPRSCRTAFFGLPSWVACIGTGLLAPACVLADLLAGKQIVQGRGSLACEANNLVAGNDINTILSDPNSMHKVLAVVDLSSNALVLVPFGGDEYEAAHIEAMLMVKSGDDIVVHAVTEGNAKPLVTRLLLSAGGASSKLAETVLNQVNKLVGDCKRVCLALRALYYGELWCAPLPEYMAPPTFRLWAK